MYYIPKKYLVKIPSKNSIVVCNKKKIIVVLGTDRKKSMKLRVKIKLLRSKNLIQVTRIPVANVANNNKKKLKFIQGTTVSLLKQLLNESNSSFCQKLKLVGVGYRVFDVENLKSKVFRIKLGYCHPVYVKTPFDLKLFCLKLTKLFILGHRYQDTSQFASQIQVWKYPDPYKGKGILHENQIIQLKEGKKV
jgi:large subunit ribosomal protein L6